LTHEAAETDNAGVMTGGPVRTSAIGLAVLAMLAMAWLPPEHVHVTHGDDGHHSEMIHRHYEAHHGAVAETAAQTPAAVDHDEHELVEWLDSPFIGPAKAWYGSASPHALSEDPPVEPSLHASGWTPVFPRVSVHDPPGRTSPGPRAPPHASCLS
jgi:hypothetical protein